MRARRDGLAGAHEGGCVRRSALAVRFVSGSIFSLLVLFSLSSSLSAATDDAPPRSPDAVAAYGEALARGDAAWADRARGQQDGVPRGAPVFDAIAAYETAIEAEPDRLEARWKLLRALHFAGEFVEQEKEAKRRLFERATRSAEGSMEWLASRLEGGDRLDEVDLAEAEARIGAAGLSIDDVARLHFWTGIDWGAWSQTVGLFSAVRQGVAKRLHRHTTIAVRLEPGYDEGGPLRLLGSLHAQLPKVPFLTGWVDRDEALPLVGRAFEMFPDNPGNQLLLATTLLELAPERRTEAVGLLQEVIASEPRPTMLVEDLAIERQARERLERLNER